jgi:hypothetical protein
MIRNLVENKLPALWLVWHIILGIVSALTPYPLIAWIYLVLSLSLIKILKSKDFFFLIAITSYLVSLELISRMADASPYIPYELGKYLLSFFLIIAVFKGYRKGFAGLAMFLLLIVSVFFDESGQGNLKNLIFNLFGPANVALAIIVFKKQEIKKDDFIRILRLLLYPLISVLAFTIIKTPDLDTIEFKLGANFETAGGFGSNQVSTALGLGTFLAFIFWRYKWNFSGLRWLDLIIFVGFAFRGLLTFSRGGMMGGALGIIIVMLFNKEGGYRIYNPAKLIMGIIPVLLVVFLTFRYADKITGGKLLLRYQGETSGTLGGTKQKTLNTYTSNRLEIFQEDLNLFKEHPLLGVGVGASRYMRETSTGYLSHVEMSRLLAEHGIPGLIYIIILFILGYKLFRYGRDELTGVILMALFTIAIFTTFHAAMRTYISPLLIGLSMLNVYSFNEETE